jgi:hypothetical protein
MSLGAGADRAHFDALPGGESWYIYYKVAGADAAAIGAQVRKMLGTISAATGIRARLMRRCDTHGGRHAEVTLLEIYERIDDPARLEAALAEGLARSGLAPALLAERHVERFRELP